MTALVLDHLWQSTLVAALLGLATLAFRHNRAAVRYWLWLAASLKFLIPFSLLVAVGAALLRPVQTAPREFYALQPAIEPFSGGPAAVTVTAAPVLDWSMVALAIWAAGLLCLAGLWLTRWSRVRAALRGAGDAG